MVTMSINRNGIIMSKKNLQIFKQTKITNLINCSRFVEQNYLQVETVEEEVCIQNVK